MNMVRIEDALADEDGTAGTRTTVVRAWLFIWFTVLFVCIAGSIWTMAAHYPDNWTGAALIIQPIVIGCSSGLLLYARKSSDFDRF